MVYYIRSEHIGRPVFETNLAGVRVWSASYLPFGGVRTATGTPSHRDSSLSCILQMHCRALGLWFQSCSRLHQNWMLDYDPTMGRYLQADPLGLVDGASVYGYVKGKMGRIAHPTFRSPHCAR